MYRSIKSLYLGASLLVASSQLMAEMSTDEIAKASQNPLTAMYSLPIQNNTYFGIGPNDRIKNIANFQPVIPVEFSENWTLVTRTILPVINNPDNVTNNNSTGSTFGLGDTTFTAFFTPKHPSKSGWLWGAGPVLYLPTATDDTLGTKKWGAGPAAVALSMRGKFVYGALVMNIWSFAGSGQSQGINKINMMTLQPFVNYNLPNGWYIASVPIITANWEADNDHRWTVPLGAGIGKAMKFGKIPGALQLHSYYNVITPDDYGETWQMRIQLQIFLPRR